MEIPLSNHLLHPCSSTVLRLLSAILLPEMSNVFVSDLLSELQMNGFAMYPIKMGFFDRTLCVQIPQVSVFPKMILTGTPSMRQLHVMSPTAASQQAMAFLAERPIAVKRQGESQIVAEQLGDASLSDELEVLRVGEQAAKRSEEKGSNGRGLAKGEQLVEDLEVGVVARGENGGLTRLVKENWAPQSMVAMRSVKVEAMEMGSARTTSLSLGFMAGEGFERHGVLQHQRGSGSDDVAMREGDGLLVAVVHDQRGLVAQIHARFQRRMDVYPITQSKKKREPEFCQL